jgi:hypothetical protein
MTWGNSGAAAHGIFDYGHIRQLEGLTSHDNFQASPFESLTHKSNPSRDPPSLTMTAQPAEGLTPEQVAFFHENGYLLIPDALSQDTVKLLLEDTNKMLNDFSLDDHPMTKFSTGGDDGADHVGDDYFLTSGDKVRFFFEEGMTITILTYVKNELV